jgi:hypothetical protein
LSLLDQGYSSFHTEEREFGDGRQDCSAKLIVVDGSGVRSVYDGSTSSQKGHAEIDALCQFLREIGWNTGTYNTYTKKIECTSKPCCKYCAAVMGLLGIIPSDRTYKSRRSMGVSYALPPYLRRFISDKTGALERDVERELQQGWS